MQFKTTRRSTRLAVLYFLVVLAVSMMACSLSITVSWEDEDESWEAIATANSHLATRVAANEAIISYLATVMPRAPRVERFPTYTPTPNLPVQGVVIIEGGRCCVGGTAGEVIQLAVDFRASSQVGQVIEMRVRAGSMPAVEREMAQAQWEPFVRHKRIPVVVPANWTGFYVSVQFRDTRGIISPVYSDDISVEGMPPTPTVSPD
jgi:hypothetical protein